MENVQNNQAEIRSAKLPKLMELWRERLKEIAAKRASEAKACLKSEQ